MLLNVTLKNTVTKGLCVCVCVCVCVCIRGHILIGGKAGRAGRGAGRGVVLNQDNGIR